MEVDKFVLNQLELLKWERDAEINESKILIDTLSAYELEKRGICIRKLKIKSKSTGLYGRSLVTFDSDVGAQLPDNSFSTGDVVGLSTSQGYSAPDEVASGVISHLSRSHVTVAFDQSHDLLDINDDAQYKLMKLANNVTYRRLKKALNDLRSYGPGPAGNLINVLFGLSEVSPPLVIDPEVFKFNNPLLDTSQKEAVLFALAQREIVVIHGPPGTGKTTTVIEVILQAVKQGDKVLACAPSNIAVDNLLEHLSAHNIKAVRLGHPARTLPTAQHHALDAILSTSDDTKIVQDVRKDIDQKVRDMKHTRNGGLRETLRTMVKELRRELREREDSAISNVLQGAQVILSTLTSAGMDGPLHYLNHDHFNMVVIDECAQSLEAACWIPMLLAPKCVLAGDHLQLPPVIQSKMAEEKGLDVTLMQRLVKVMGDRVTRLLTVQYRMNEKIMQWSSSQLYESKLTAHSSVANHLLRDLPGVKDNEYTCQPLLLIDSAGCDLYELDLQEESSKGNEGEANVVAAYIKRLADSGVATKDLAVITPYSLQVELLRMRLLHIYPDLEIKTVDGFQGREKEAVIMSLVRSNPSGEVGFLAEDRRINVAVTRARRHLCLVCDSETVSHHGFLKSLIDYMMDNGETYSAEYLIDDEDDNSPFPRRATVQQGNKKQHKKPRQHKSSSSKTKDDAGSSTRPDGGSKQPKKDDEDRKTEVKNKLQAFLEDLGQTELSFPPTNSYHRRLVHEIAEKLGMVTDSLGEGRERFVTVKKRKMTDENDTAKGGSASPRKQNSYPSTGRREISEDRTMDHSSCPRSKPSSSGKSQPSFSVNGVTRRGMIKEDSISPPTSESQGPESSEDGDSNPIVNTTQEGGGVGPGTCEICGALVPRMNLQLHILHCNKLVRTGAPIPSSKPSRVKPAPRKTKPEESKKSKTKRAKGATKATVVHSEEAAGVDDDGFEDLLASVVKSDRTCHFGKCKTAISVIFQNCELCNKRYCLTHFVPEVHGCGEAARAAARQSISRERALYPGSGVPSKKPDPTRRGHLERKLQGKLNKMADQRGGGGSKS